MKEGKTEEITKGNKTTVRPPRSLCLGLGFLLQMHGTCLGHFDYIIANTLLTTFKGAL